MAFAARLLLLLASLVPVLAPASGTNGHEEETFEQFRVRLDVRAGGARAPGWYVPAGTSRART